MEVPTTYGEVMKFCPVQACGAIAKLQASKSKFRKQDPATLPWTFFWGFEVKSETIHDVLAKRAAKRSSKLQTLDEMIEARKAQTFVTVCVKNYAEALPKGTIPDAILQQIIEAETKVFEEKKRVDSLTPDQLKAEAQDILKQFTVGGGLTIVLGG